MQAQPQRLLAVDWLRGLAVLFMVQCHAMWLLTPALRASPGARALSRLDSLVAPAFLFSAGFALALLLVRAAAKGPVAPRARKNLRRAGEVLAAATLVNAMWFNLWREPKWIVRMDILHCVGVSLVLCLALTVALVRAPAVLRAVALSLALAVFFAAPLAEPVRGPWAGLLNRSGEAVFPLVPWLGFALLGVWVGAVAAREGRAGMARALGLLVVLGTAGWALAGPLRALYPPHAFSVTNPSDSARRVAWVALVLLGLMALEPRAAAQPGRVRLVVERFGTASLAAYVLHEGLLFYRVFGLSFSRFFADSVGWGLYWVLTVALLVLTYGGILALDAASARWRGWLAWAWERVAPPVLGAPRG